MDDEAPHVLVVEDESGLVELFEIWLADQFAVTTATDGESALGELDASIDAIILDWRLPDQSGEAILEEIRSLGIQPAVAVVTGAEPETEGIGDSVDMILKKPIRREELIEALQRLVG